MSDSDRKKTSSLAAGRARAQRKLAADQEASRHREASSTPADPPQTSKGMAAGRARAQEYLDRPGNNLPLNTRTHR